MTKKGNDVPTKGNIENEAEEIKALIHESKKDACIFALVILQSIINEQISAKQLKRDVGTYIYKAIKDQFIRKGWIEK